ncbi:MAG: 2Fe-2S iron-sulfur cluster binding domain-containing protein [Clostridiales bacterium]|nr:2Fe-2S iron-sulfur cluster binding domain-containing protein [Clostridiales bacterium]
MNTIIMTVAAISAITGFLALLLSVANRTIANYGEKKILINNEKEYIVDGGDSLLSALIENEIFIPSACGGKGSCGYCKVKVTEGGGTILPTELGYVTTEEQKEGIRLSCQCKVKEDLKIEIPEELFNVKQYDYIVEKIEQVTDKIKHLRLKLPKDNEIDFKPGQYIQILSPVYKESDEEVYRAYSIASSATDKNYIELLIGYVPGGKCTTYIHNYLKENDKLTIVGPFGDFFYHNSDREMILVGIGTGMAPILAILRYMRDNNIQRKGTFYFGARTKEDLFLTEEIDEIAKTLKDIEIVYTLSRPTPECNWTGPVGRVNDLLDKKLDDCSNLEAYLCGSPLMIDAVLDVFKKKNFEEQYIFYDKF